MSKITSKFWMFGKQNEPADDFDSDYDTIYYGEKSEEENTQDAYNDDVYAQDDISEVKVVTEEVAVEPEATEAEPEVEEEPLYKVILAIQKQKHRYYHIHSSRRECDARILCVKI